MPRFALPLLLLALLSAVIPSGRADALTLTAENQGQRYCCPLGHHPFGSFTGSESWVEYRSYYIFDTSTLSGPVTAATLRLFDPVGGFRSPDPTETLTLFDVTSNLSVLAGWFLGGFAEFEDIGTGTSFGSVSVSEADEGVWVELVLNADGLAAINARIGTTRHRIGFGGALTTLAGGPAPESVFAQSGELAQLELTVPEPGGCALLATALGALIWRGRPGGPGSRRRSARRGPSSGS